MDINLSTEDLQFRDEVRSFFEENKINFIVGNELNFENIKKNYEKYMGKIL